MCAKDVTLEVGDDSYPGRLNVPEEPTGQGLLMVPGGGHGPFGDIFLRFARRAADDGYTVARFETWPFPADLEKPGEEFEAELEASVEFLQEQGCSTITVIAKSFGGRVTVQHLPDDVDRLVLWAPVVLFGDHDDSPSVTAAELAEIDIPVRLLQGEEDDVVSVENAEQLVGALPEGELVTLPGEDHSFGRDPGRIMDETMDFLPHTS